nr:hypothetical protein [Tanacetum cinerariifolium]
MSSSTDPIIRFDSNVDDAFSLKNIPNYTSASPNYFPASPGNAFSDPSENLAHNLLAALAISPFHNDPYDDPPPSPDFFLPKEILPPQKRARFLSH